MGFREWFRIGLNLPGALYIFFNVGTLTKFLLTIREKPVCLFLLVEGCRYNNYNGRCKTSKLSLCSILSQRDLKTKVYVPYVGKWVTTGLTESVPLGEWALV